MSPIVLVTGAGRVKQSGDHDLLGEELSALYDNRFSDRELADKSALWSVLCTDVFQQYVPRDGTVLDLGAGRCEFTNAIRGATPGRAST